MKYEIAVCTKEGDSTTFKGNLLEKPAREILEVQQYKVTENVRITGMEIDLLPLCRIMAAGCRNPCNFSHRFLH